MSIEPAGDRFTRRKRAEKALRESEARTAAIMEAALDSIITCDQRGSVLDFNPAAERMFGFARIDVLGHDLADLIIPARLRAAHRAGMAHYLATGEGPALRKRIEMPALRADRTEFLVELTIVPIVTDGSKLFTAYLRDITERRQGEKVLSERTRLTALRADLSARLATAEPMHAVLQQCAELLVEHLGVALARIWTQTQASKGFELQASAGSGGIRADSRGADDVAYFRIDRIADKRQPHLTNDAPNDPDLSDPQWARREGIAAFAGYPLLVENRAIGVLAMFCRDRISQTVFSELAPIADGIAQYVERKRSEEDLQRSERTARFLAEASAALAYLTDYESTLQQVARLAVPHFADWCAIDVLDADGQRRRLAVTNADPEKVRAARKLEESYPPRADAPYGPGHVMRTGEPELVEDIPDALLSAMAHDAKHLGVIRQMGMKSYICVPIKSFDRMLGAISFVTAESGRRYDAADLRLAQDLAYRAAVAIRNASLYQALQETDRRKDEFLATLAHELRNPLAPMRNSLEIMKRSGADTAVMDQVRLTMERQLGQMVRLVDDLLNVSRISRDQLDLRKERIELGVVMHSAVETSRSLIDSMGHRLTVTLPPQPLFLDADPTRLAQVFLNLLNNAAKYSDRGGDIRVAAERRGTEVVITVSDTGIGIPAEMLPKIFDMFTQVDRSLERSQGGLGIGLTLVKRLVELHGGTIQAHSRGPGSGSQFLVRLPAPTQRQQERPPAVTKVSQPNASGCRILVVDDNRDSAESLAMLLRLTGNDVHTAHDGEQALTAAASLRPEVMLLDIGMPIMNGYEAARRIREYPWGRDILLVALTGLGQEQDRLRSREAGFNRHLVKPVDLDALQALLASLGRAAGGA